MESSSNIEVTAEMLAEASAWAARLHGPKRTARTEAGFKTWLAAHPGHARAFERTTAAWEAVGSVPSEALSSMIRWDRVGVKRQWPRPVSLAAAASLIGVIAGLFFVTHDSALTTDVGEQRVLTLEDGTRVYLNTASRLRVRYEKRLRQIEFEEGEALFDVAKEAGRPFIVVAGDKEILALGTSFVVRRERERLAVTLVDGAVNINESLSAPSRSPAPLALNPGERLTFTTHRAPTLDRPAVEKVTAWQRGLVILDGTKLSDAVVEMNRYSTVELQVDNVDAAELRISGAFRTGDSVNFAKAMAMTYRLELLDEGDRVVLRGTPHVTYAPPLQ